MLSPAGSISQSPVRPANLLPRFNMSVPRTPSNLPTALVSRFSPRRAVSGYDNLSSFFATLLEAELGEDEDELVEELKTYLKHYQLKTERHVSSVLSNGSLPSAIPAIPEKGSLPLLSSAPVMAVFADIAKLIGTIAKENLFLLDSVSLSDLREIEKSVYHANGRLGHCSTTTATSTSNATKDLPVFKVKAFSGKDEDGPEWAAQVESDFRQNGVLDYLTDTTCCTANIHWSDALAERLRSALLKGAQSALAEEMKKEKDCSIVWAKITDQFDNQILQEAKQMCHWLDLFALRVDDISEFETYLNKLKEIIILLRNLSSVAIKDTTLIRAIITRGVHVPELTNCMVEIVKDHTIDSDAIISKLKRDFQAIEKLDASVVTASNRSIRGGYS